MSREQVQRIIAGSHAVHYRATVCSEYQTGADPEGLDIEVMGGQVELDGSADVQGTLELTTPGEGMWPRRASDPLAPAGNEVFVAYGVGLRGGSDVLWTPLGYYRIATPEQPDAASGPIRIQAVDRMRGLVRARFLVPRQIRAGQTVGEIFRALVREVYPKAEIAFADAQVEFARLRRGIVIEEGRYEFLREIADSYGQLMFFDNVGVLRVEPAPDPAAHVWEVAAGPGGVQLELSRRVSDDGAYNAWVVRGEGADADRPVMAWAVDADPRSMTYYYGRYGPYPRYYSSPLITEEFQARHAATAMLRRNLGFPYSVDFQAIVNPTLRPWDPVRVELDDFSRESHVMQRATIPLSADGVADGSTREQTRVLIGVGP